MTGDEPRLNQETRGFTRAVAAGVLIIALGILISGAAMGRVWWCAAGDLWPWTWDIWSRHCSQHLIDPYTISHLQHGIGLYLLLTVLGDVA